MRDSQLGLIILALTLLQLYNTYGSVPADNDTVKYKPQQPAPSDEEASKRWVEKDGIIIIEAENITDSLPEGWIVQQAHQGYQGRGYLQWAGEGMWGPETYAYHEMPQDRMVTYYFKINTPGIYFVKLRNYHLKKDGDNDVWISVGEGNFGKLYDFETNAWTFDERGTWGSYQLEAGKVYKVQLAGRSSNFNVDRIHIFHSSKVKLEYKPKGGKIIPRFSDDQAWEDTDLKESEVITYRSLQENRNRKSDKALTNPAYSYLSSEDSLKVYNRNTAFTVE